MYFEPEHHPFVPPRELTEGRGEIHPVAIVGAGPIGLTLALGLSQHGVPCVLLEDDDHVSDGSRALGMSRRTLEIWDALGVSGPISAKACGWSGGRSFYRGRTVLEFGMPHDPRLKYPPMLNLQQCHTEQFLVDSLASRPEVDLRWQSRVSGLRDEGDRIVLAIDTPAGSYDLAARYVVACDGARSVVRSALGLKLEGTSYEARYVIVDVKLRSKNPMERRAWFDPPSNPGSTILMHGQPDDIWRIDYQLREDEDAEEAVKPENVLPRVRSHLDWIGEGDDWELEWVSIYRAHARTLDRYRHGRVLFAGDAAHLVPIFGIRGLNSGVEDSWNLAWKLAYVHKGLADEALLDSYSDERVAVARENLEQASRSTWFMTPPTRGLRMMRDAVLSLAADHPEVREIINPRQAATVPLRHSPLSSFPERSAEFSAGPMPGEILPDLGAATAGPDGGSHACHLQSLVSGRFAALCFFGAAQPPADDKILGELAESVRGLPCDIIVVASGEGIPAGANSRPVVTDPSGALHDSFGAIAGTVYLIRPDHHIAAGWRQAQPAELRQAVEAALGRLPIPTETRK